MIILLINAFPNDKFSGNPTLESKLKNFVMVILTCAVVSPCFANIQGHYTGTGKETDGGGTTECQEIDYRIIQKPDYLMFYYGVYWCGETITHDMSLDTFEVRNETELWLDGNVVGSIDSDSMQAKVVRPDGEETITYEYSLQPAAGDSEYVFLFAASSSTRGGLYKMQANIKRISGTSKTKDAGSL